MQDFITNIIGTGVAMSPIVMILVEGIKTTNIIPSRYSAVVAITVGVGFGVLLSFAGQGTMIDLSIAGVVSGGVAAGLYDVANSGKGDE